MEVFRTISDYKAWRRKILGTVSFVPTMGALHEGHAELLREACEVAPVRVLSIFVNPTQFGPKEDLSKYPRTLEQDLEIAKREQVSAVFVPDVNEIYSAHGALFSSFVEENHFSQGLCGAFRPGHFRGVCTVVLKLFNIVEPSVALFGWKDAQQFLVLRKMVQDLALDVDIRGCETVREASGLALSSRNRYLSEEDRVRAVVLYQVLSDVRGKLEKSKSVGEVLIKACNEITSSGFELQYLELKDIATWESVKALRSGREYLLAVAAFLNGTRLIDNVRWRAT